VGGHSVRLRWAQDRERHQDSGADYWEFHGSLSFYRNYYADDERDVRRRQKRLLRLVVKVAKRTDS